MWEQSDTTVPWEQERRERAFCLAWRVHLGARESPWPRCSLSGAGAHAGAGAPGLRSPLQTLNRWRPGAPRGKGRGQGGPGGRPRGLLPWLAGRRAGQAGGSGGARAGRASVGTASLRRAPRALGTPPPPLLLALVLPPVLPSPLPLRPPRPGSNILRRLEHARLENNTTFQKPFQERPVPEGKEPGLLLLF